jgi:Holliday junction resolvase
VGGSEYAVGKAYEYKLMRILMEKGYYVVRGPASGRRATRIFYPDVLAVKKGSVLLVEVKHRGDARAVTISKRKYNMLKWASEVTGGRALVCVHYTTLGGFRCLDVDGYDRETPGGYVYYYVSFEQRGFDPSVTMI